MKKFDPSKIKLSKYEQSIEDEIETYVPVSKEEFDRTSKMLANTIAARKKNAVLNIRINQGDLENIKEKAKRLGVKYQTFIAEILHNFAQNEVLAKKSKG
jgi:predicted DNA binding CopG/RHH family protein